LYEYAIAWDWITFAVRWLHVITAIAWIGSSFYFVALDLGLKKHAALPPGAYGEEWQVHGGGFYHIQKYLVAPANMPDHLVWFKWESYVTWLSGFGMLCLVYYAGADLYMIDPAVLDVSKPVAIAISLGTIAGGWIMYDLICKSPFGNDNTRLMVALYFILVAVAWGYTHLFTGRAAFLHLGAFTATIMSANVFFIIIPNQKIVVADLLAGRTPDAKYGRIAKQRSTHNNYLTLPVLFLMLSNHYPLAFGTQFNWIIASLVFLMGVTIRHYFNTRHANAGNPDGRGHSQLAPFFVERFVEFFPVKPKHELNTVVSHFVAKLNHSVLVRFHLRKMQSDVLVELLKEWNPVADQDRQDRITNFVCESQSKALGGDDTASNKPYRTERWPQPVCHELHEVA